MAFRIGISLGDIIEDGGRIYGDGINIAARIEGIAEGGGICLSGTAYNQVKNKLNLDFAFLGEQTVKNISDPVRVYRIRPESKTGGETLGQKREKLGPWQKGVLSGVCILMMTGVAWVLLNFYLHPIPEDVASVEKMVFPLPDKPSIAVLPFVNMSRDQNQGYFADGISENIISALFHIPQMFVIARNSTFTYKGPFVERSLDALRRAGLPE